MQYMLSLVSDTVWGLPISLPQDAVHVVSYVWYCVGTVYLSTTRCSACMLSLMSGTVWELFIYLPQYVVHVISYVW